MRHRYRSPRERVAEHLCALGIDCQAEDVVSVRGSRLADVSAGWSVVGACNGRRVEVASCYGLRECQGGVRLIHMEERHCLYGNVYAKPSKEPDPPAKYFQDRPWSAKDFGASPGNQRSACAQAKGLVFSTKKWR